MLKQFRDPNMITYISMMNCQKNKRNRIIDNKPYNNLCMISMNFKIDKGKVLILNLKKSTMKMRRLSMGLRVRRMLMLKTSVMKKHLMMGKIKWISKETQIRNKLWPKITKKSTMTIASQMQTRMSKLSSSHLTTLTTKLITIIDFRTQISYKCKYHLIKNSIQIIHAGKVVEKTMTSSNHLSIAETIRVIKVWHHKTCKELLSKNASSALSR